MLMPIGGAIAGAITGAALHDAVPGLNSAIDSIPHLHAWKTTIPDLSEAARALEATGADLPRNPLVQARDPRVIGYQDANTTHTLTRNDIMLSDHIGIPDATASVLAATAAGGGLGAAAGGLGNYVLNRQRPDDIGRTVLAAKTAGATGRALAGIPQFLLGGIPSVVGGQLGVTSGARQAMQENPQANPTAPGFGAGTVAGLARLGGATAGVLSGLGLGALVADSPLMSGTSVPDQTMAMTVPALAGGAVGSGLGSYYGGRAAGRAVALDPLYRDEGVSRTREMALT